MHGHYQPMEKCDAHCRLKEVYQLWFSIDFAFLLYPVLKRCPPYL